MKPFIPSVCLILLVGCTQDPAPPWRWMELGHRPLSEAWDAGEWIRVDIDDRTHWVILGPETTPPKSGHHKLHGADLHCGDRLKMHPKDGHPDWLAALPDLGPDSVTLHCQCANLAGLAQWHQQRMRWRPAEADSIETQWVALLRRHRPDTLMHIGAPLSAGDSIRLAISTMRADGVPLEPDTLRLSFILGEPDQIVPALEPGLSKVTDASRWTTWSNAQNAFGPGPHPDLGLPAHMPLQFSVKVE